MKAATKRANVNERNVAMVRIKSRAGAILYLFQFKDVGLLD